MIVIKNKMTEIPLNNFYDNVVDEFESINNCDVYVWWDDFINYLRTEYNCEYWERESQYGGPCFIFQNDKDVTFFKLKFS